MYSFLRNHQIKRNFVEETGRFMITGAISFDFDFLPLLIVVGIGWAVPMIMNALNMKRAPTVVAEIIAGYLIGSFLLGTTDSSSDQVLRFLALAGFILLMFQSGLEIDVKKIRFNLPRRHDSFATAIQNPLISGLIIFMLTLLLSFVSTLLLGLVIPIKNSWYFALIMITTSVGIILPVLKNSGETDTLYGQVLITGSAIADILSILLFTFSAFIIRHGFQWKIFLVLLLFVLLYLFYYLGSHIHRNTIFRKLTYELSHAASQIKVRGTILLILIFVVLSQQMGEEVMLLGAFLSGILLSGFVSKERDLLLQKIDGIGYGFFIPIFFIMVGARFDASALSNIDGSLFTFLALMLVTLYGVKMLPALILKKQFGTRKALAAGILLSSRLSLIIAAATIGLDLDIISEETNAVFILMAVVTCLLSPVLYNQISFRKIHTGEKTVIVGGSSTAVLLARRLNMHGKHAIIIENNTDRYREIIDKGLNIVYGSGIQREAYQKAGLTHNDYVVVLTADNTTNFNICAFLRNHLNHDKILTKSNSRRLEEQLNYIDVRYMDVTRTLATALENHILRPTAYKALVETFENFNIEEVVMTNRHYNNYKLSEMPLHPDVSFLLYKHDDVMDLPHGDTKLHTGDTIFAFGTESALQDTRKKLVEG